MSAVAGNDHALSFNSVSSMEEDYDDDLVTNRVRHRAREPDPFIVHQRMLSLDAGSSHHAGGLQGDGPDPQAGRHRLRRKLNSPKTGQSA
jgi:hypothetical protein